MQEDQIPQQTPPVAPPQTPVTTPPQPLPVFSAGTVSAPAGGKKKKLLIGIIVGAMLVAGGVAFGVYAYITNTPDYLLGRATAQLAEESKTAMAAKFKVTSGTDSTGVNFSGDIAYRADTNNNKNGEMVVGVGSGNSRVTLTARVIDEAMYLRFGSLNNLTNLLRTFADEDVVAAYDSPEFTTALDRINDKWYSLTKEELQNVAQGTGSTTTVSDSITPEDLQKVLDLYNKHKVLKVDKTFADEDIDNVKTAHFSVKLDKDELTAFLTDVKNANLKSIKVSDEDIADAGTAAADFNRSAATEVWITRDSKKLKQVKVTSTETGSEGALTLTLVTELPQFDKLEKPAESKPFSELMTELLGPAAGIQQSELDATDYELYYQDEYVQ